MRWIVALLALAAVPARAQTPGPGDLVINEVMYDPPAPQASSNEWVEVLNVSGGPLQLGGLALADAASTSDPIGPTTLAAGGSLVLVRDAAAFAAAYPGVEALEVDGFPALNNSGDRPALVLEGAEIDAVPYLPSWGGADASLERIDPLGPSTAASNFGTSTAPGGATPGAQNSLFSQDTDPPALDGAEALDAQSVLVSFSEPVEALSAEDEGNYSIAGIGAPAAAMLADDPSQVLLALGAPLQGPATFTLTVSGVADRGGNVLVEAQTSFFFGQGAEPGFRDVVVNEFLYDEPTADNPGEFVELFNRTDQTFDLRDFTYNDGTGDDAPITGDAVFLGPGEYAVLVEDGALFSAVFPGVPFVEPPSWSALNNTGDAVVIKYLGAVVDSLSYTPAWGGEDASLERVDPAGPSARSNFATTTSPPGTPGAQNSVFEPDVTGPTLVAATASPDGLTVLVDLDEPLDPSTVEAQAFTVSGGPGVTAAAYDDADLTVTLALSSRLAAGASTVTARGLADLQGNVTASTSTTVVFTPDTVPPTITRALAEGATAVRVEFSEPVTDATASDPATYGLDGGIGPPLVASTEPDADGGVEAAVLGLAAPLADGQTYTVTASGLTDLAGNVQPSTQASFFVGQGAVPDARDLVVNEFLYDEPTAGNPGEFVELFNRSDRTFDLSAFTLNDGTGDAAPITDAPVFVGPGEYAVIVEDGALFAAVFPGVPFVEQAGWSALNNGGDAIVLAYQGAAVDSLTYDPEWGGEDASLERKDPDGPSTVAANFATTTSPPGTPGAQNSVFEPDVTGPTLVSAEASPDGRTVVVETDEPLDPASVAAGAFSVDGGPAVTGVAYAPLSTSVTLSLEAPLAEGASTVTASGLRDLLGNTTASTQTTVSFAPDATPPRIARATAPTASTVRVTFSEPVTEASATAAGAYTVEGGPGAAGATVEAREGGGVTAVLLTLAGGLEDRTLYTLSVAGLEDLAGNVAASSARFFVGTADTPGPGDVVVNEILFDPVVGSDGEYLEVLNTTDDRVFDLSRITLDDGDGDGQPLSDDAAVLLPGEALALARDADGFRAAFPEAAFVEAGTVVGLSNSGEAVVLRAGGTVVDSVFYDPDWHRVELDDATGLSLERRDPAGPSNDTSNWSTSLDPRGGTPSAANTLSVSDRPVEREPGLTVTSPFAPTLGEAAQITYALSTEAALVRARIFDGGGRPVRELEAGRLSGATATLTWDGTDDDRRPLRAGIYVVLLEAVDAQGGTTEALRGVVVLARP